MHTRSFHAQKRVYTRKVSHLDFQTLDFRLKLFYTETLWTTEASNLRSFYTKELGREIKEMERKMDKHQEESCKCTSMHINGLKLINLWHLGCPLPPLLIATQGHWPGGNWFWYRSREHNLMVELFRLFGWRTNSRWKLKVWPSRWKPKQSVSFSIQVRRGIGTGPCQKNAVVIAYKSKPENSTMNYVLRIETVQYILESDFVEIWCSLHSWASNRGHPAFAVHQNEQIARPERG